MQSYPGPNTPTGKQRMKEDAAMIADPTLWPRYGQLHLKEQPWIKANGRRYGLIARADVKAGIWAVCLKDSEDIELYDTLEELVEVWTVD